MKGVRLRLYVSGAGPNSVAARAHLDACLRGTGVPVEIIDLLQHPRRALDDGIIVTPTLVRLGPGGSAVMVGDLRDQARLLVFLGVGEGAQ